MLAYLFYYYKNKYFSNFKGPITIELFTICFIYLIINRNRLLKYLKNAILKKIKNTSYVKQKKQEAVDTIKGSFFKKDPNYNPIIKLPLIGYSPEKINSELINFKSSSSKTLEQGKISGTVYTADNKLSEVIINAIKEYQFSNPLHSDIFPGLKKMESSIVSMCLNLFKAPDTAIGNITSGGTESIMMAVKAYRDYSRENYDIENPEMIICRSAHVAFNKAAHYLGIKLIIIDERESDRKMNVDAMKSAINNNTICVVASAPSFPHGVIDPVEEISIILEEHNKTSTNKVGFHLDSCLGGFIIPFMDITNNQNSGCNFTTMGITSISVDTHKYGYSPKGSSLILYRERKYAHSQYMVEPNWPGGIYISPTIAGSRSGALIAATWSTLIYHGLNGYLEKTQKIIANVRYITNQLIKIPEINLMAKPDTTVISFTSKKFNIYKLAELLSKKNWNLNALQFPPSVHICLTDVHTKEVCEQFLLDIHDSIKEINDGKADKVGGVFGIYGSSQNISDRSLIKEIGYEYLDAYYSN